MSGTACPHCPFRVGSRHGFCVDGMDALNSGAEPSCHLIVGPAMQFDDPLPEREKQCEGFHHWVANVAGFTKPYFQEVAYDQPQ